LERQGVLENAEAFASKVVVARDGDNPNRVNVLLPIDVVNPLDILAANATIYKQYRDQPVGVA
jgi:phage tail sheath gpL-like